MNGGWLRGSWVEGRWFDWQTSTNSGYGSAASSPRWRNSNLHLLQQLPSPRRRHLRLRSVRRQAATRRPHFLLSLFICHDHESSVPLGLEIELVPTGLLLLHNENNNENKKEHDYATGKWAGGTRLIFPSHAHMLFLRLSAEKCSFLVPDTTLCYKPKQQA